MNLKNLLSLTCVFPIAFATHSFGSDGSNINDPLFDDTLSQHSYQSDYDDKIVEDSNDERLNWCKRHHPTPEGTSCSSDSYHSDGDLPKDKYDYFTSLKAGYRRPLIQHAHAHWNKREKCTRYITSIENIKAEMNELQEKIKLLQASDHDLLTKLSIQGENIGKTINDTSDYNIFVLNKKMGKQKNEIQKNIEKVSTENKQLFDKNIEATKEELIKEIQNKYDELNKNLNQVKNFLDITGDQPLQDGRLFRIEQDIRNLTGDYALLIQRIGNPTSLITSTAFDELGGETIKSPKTLEKLLEYFAKRLTFINQELNQKITDSINGALTELNNTDKSQNNRLKNLEERIKETNLALDDFASKTTEEHNSIVASLTKEVKSQIDSQETRLKLQGMIQNQIDYQLLNDMQSITNPINERISQTEKQALDINTMLNQHLTASQENENRQHERLQKHTNQINKAQNKIDEHTDKLISLENDKINMQNGMENMQKNMELNTKTTILTIQQNHADLLEKLHALDEASQQGDQTLEKDFNKNLQEINQEIESIQKEITGITNFIGEIPDISISEEETLVQQIAALQTKLSKTISDLDGNIELANTNNSKIAEHSNEIQEIQIQNEQHEQTFETFKASTIENLENKQQNIDLLKTFTEEAQGRFEAAEKQLEETSQLLETTISRTQEIEATGKKSVEDINKLNTELKTTNSELTSLSNLAETVKTQSEENLEKINLLDTNLSTTTSNLEETKQKLDTIEKTTETLGNTLENHTNDISTINTNIDTINTANVNLNAATRLNTLESGAEEAQNKIKDLDNSMTTLTSSVETNKEDLSKIINANQESAEKSIQLINESITDHGVKLGELADRLTQQEDQSTKNALNLETIDKLVDDHTESLKTLSSNSEENSQNIEGLTDKFNIMENNLKTTTERIDQIIINEIDPLKSDMRETKSLIDNNKNDANTKIEESNKLIKDAQDDINEMKTKINSVESIASTNQLSLTEIQKENIVSKEDIKTLQENVTQINQDNTNNKTQIEDLYKSHEEMASKLTTLKDTTVSGLETDVATQGTEINTIQTTLTDLKNTMIPALDKKITDNSDTLTTITSDLNKKIAESHDELTKINTEIISGLDTRINQNSIDLTTMKNTTIPNLETKITKSSDDLLTKINTEIISGLDTRINQNSIDLTTMKNTTIPNLETKITTESTTLLDEIKATLIPNALKDVKDTLNTLPNLEKRVEDLQTDIESLEIKTKQLDVDDLKKKINETNSAIDTHTTDTTSMIATLRNEFQGKINDLSANIKEIKAMLSGAPTDNGSISK